MSTQPTLELPLVNGAAGLVPRHLVFPWPMQPRKNFPLEYLNELASSIEQHGILNDLICRPRPGHPGQLEIIGGECRWRSSEMAGKSDLPVKVRDLSDGEALELALVDNMRRRDLSPLEECDAFYNSMAQKNPDGAPRYASINDFAAKINVSPGYVQQRLRLRKLPVEGREAMSSGRLSFEVARVVCSKPERIVGQLLDVVLNPMKHSVWIDGEGFIKEPLNAEQAQQVITQRFVRDLRDAPFNLGDANLLPVSVNEGNERHEGGSCLDCPWNSVNAPKEEGAAKVQGRWCFNPGCYTRKVEISSASEVLKAQEAGHQIMPAEKADEILNADGSLKPTAAYVNLDEKPAPSDRNGNIPEKNVPKWEKIVVGETAPPVMVAFDKRGKAHRLVERSHAVTAAQANKTAHFLSLSSGAGNSVQTADVRERTAAENKEKKLKGEVALEVVGVVIERLEEDTERTGEFWTWLVFKALMCSSANGVAFVARRRYLAAADSHEKMFARAMKRMGGCDKCALAVELLLASGVQLNGIGDESLRKLARIFKVDVEKIDRRVRAEAKKKEKPAKVEKPTKTADDVPAAPAALLPPPLAPRVKPKSRVDKDADLLMKARELRASGRAGTIGALISNLHVGYNTARRLLVEIATEEAAAVQA